MSSKGSSALSSKRAAAAAAAAAVKSSHSLSALDDKNKKLDAKADDESVSSDDEVEAIPASVEAYPSSGLLSLSHGASIAADAHAAAVATESSLLDDQTPKRHKSKWSRDVSRLIGQHIPFQQFAPYNESGNTRNLLRGYCKMCTRKVTICCKKCHVYLCIEVFSGDDGLETKSCWEVFHTEADPDLFMNKTASNKRAEKVHRQQLAAQHANHRQGSETEDGLPESSSSNAQPVTTAPDDGQEDEDDLNPAVIAVRDDGKDEAEAVTFSWENKDKKKRMRDK